ncbi:MAG: GNAT family N-acetyltransferase [Phycisphaeraceae bacterium]
MSITSNQPALGVSIRPARRDEIALLVEFQLRLAAETESLALDRPTVQQGVAALFDHPERGRYWFAEVDGRVAGCMLDMMEWSDWRNGGVLWIHSVYIHPDMRRRGLFRAMYQHLVDKVNADPSLKGLRLFVDKTNTAAQATYRSMGMSDEHYQLFEWMK